MAGMPVQQANRAHVRGKAGLPMHYTDTGLGIHSLHMQTRRYRPITRVWARRHYSCMP